MCTNGLLIVMLAIHTWNAWHHTHIADGFCRKNDTSVRAQGQKVRFSAPVADRTKETWKKMFSLVLKYSQKRSTTSFQKRMNPFARSIEKHVHSKSRSFSVYSEEEIWSCVCYFIVSRGQRAFALRFIFFFENFVSNHCKMIMRRKNSNENYADCHLEFA